MKRITPFLICSLAVFVQLHGQHKIIPAQRLLSGNTEQRMERDTTGLLSFSLWTHPEGQAQLLDAGSVKHSMQTFTIAFIADRFDCSVSAQTHLPDFYAVQTVAAYTFPLTYDVSLRGGVASVLGDNGPILYYPTSGSSIFMEGFLQLRYEYRKKITVYIIYDCGWYHINTLTILDPKRFRYETGEQEGILRGIGFGWETPENLNWYHSNKLYIYGGTIHPVHAEWKVMRGLFNHHCYIGLSVDYTKTIQGNDQFGYAMGVKWRI